jgi:hypothetical protein
VIKRKVVIKKPANKAKPATAIKVQNKVIKQKVVIKKPAKNSGTKVIVRSKQQRQVLITPKKAKPSLQQRGKLIKSAKRNKAKKTKIMPKGKKSLKVTKKSTQLKIKNRH